MKRAGTLLAAVASAVCPVFAAVGGAILLGACGSCQSTVQTIAIGALAGATYDGAAVDQGTHRVYLANESDKSVAMIDVSSSTPRYLGSVALSDAPHGLAVAPDRQLVYAGMGSSGVAVIDGNPSSRTSGQVLATIPIDTGGVDLLDYSPKTGSLYLGVDDSVVVVDATTRKVTRRVSTASAVEQPRYDPRDGRIYVAVPDTDTLVQIDPSTGYVTQSYVLTRCRPKGVGINPARQLALVACGSSIARVNLNSGAYDVTRVVQGGDIVNYDAASDRFTVGSSHGPLDSAIGVFDGSGRFLSSVSSSPTAKAAVYDARHGVVYAAAPAGLMSFAAGACEPPPEWLRFAGGLSLFAVPVVAAALFLVWYARRMRSGPRAPSRPSDRDLREEDLAMERERMRALEDAMFGPEG